MFLWRRSWVWGKKWKRIANELLTSERESTVALETRVAMCHQVRIHASLWAPARFLSAAEIRALKITNGLLSTRDRAELRNRDQVLKTAAVSYCQMSVHIGFCLPVNVKSFECVLSVKIFKVLIFCKSLSELANPVLCTTHDRGRGKEAPPHWWGLELWTSLKYCFIEKLTLLILKFIYPSKFIHKMVISSKTFQ